MVRKKRVSVIPRSTTHNTNIGSSLKSYHKCAKSCGCVKSRSAIYKNKAKNKGRSKIPAQRSITKTQRSKIKSALRSKKARTKANNKPKPKRKGPKIYRGFA